MKKTDRKFNVIISIQMQSQKNLDTEVAECFFWAYLILAKLVKNDTFNCLKLKKLPDIRTF